MGNGNVTIIQAEYYPPTIPIWYRLEGRPRAQDFSRALKAEVRDALWMVSRQRQMGEFIGSDNGSPVLAKAHVATTTLTKYRAGTGTPVLIEPDIPLEVKVENQEIPFQLGDQAVSLDLRLLMGRQWLKLIKQVDNDLRKFYIDEYGIKKPDKDSESDAKICAQMEVWQQFAAVAGRNMDGYKLYRKIKDVPGFHAYEGIVGLDTAKQTAIDILADKFVHWFEKLYYQPVEQKNASWKPEYLEHQFSCSAPQDNKQKVLTAREYYHGHLDWYNLDIDDKSQMPAVPGEPATQDVEDSFTHSFIPTSVTFGGMPYSRWWTFEDWKTDLNYVNTDKTDLNKLLLLQFALVYSNDWFLVPFTLPLGTIARVKGLMVTNVFGEKTWIQAAGTGSDEDWRRWSMYNMEITGNKELPADTNLALLPVARKVLEGKPTEEIFMLRDEIANMVWGVESIVPLPTGKGKPGREVGYELKNKLQQLLDANNPAAVVDEYNADIRYQLVNTVPEQWIPFISVHIENDDRQMQLQRAAMPRILVNDTKIPKKVEPRTSLLREGLDKSSPEKYFIHEEEVPRAGIKVRKSFQRTRWFNGKVYTWMGIRKQVGRGEGSSGLAFDQIVPVKRSKKT